MDACGFVRNNFLLIASAVLALFSLFIVPFDTVVSYDYPRILRTICTLLLFLVIVGGLKECRALQKLAHAAVGNLKTTTSLCLVLILLPFFCAMLFSNDVALLTFVPLAIAVLRMAEMKSQIAIVVVLQTAAANVGSYLTPFGNPHNLYMFNLSDYYGFSIIDYEMALIPIVAVGTVALMVMALLIPRKTLSVDLQEVGEVPKPKVAVIMALFVAAILAVLNVIPLYIALIGIVAVFLVMMPKIFLRIDYSILLIFLFLFVFANGITNLDSVHSAVSGLMDSNPMVTTVLVSQFTTNVASTILLQPFTNDWAAVLVGADIGGFGTPIASMASVISLRFYMLDKEGSLKDFFKMFVLVNAVMLAVLIPAYYLFVA